MKRQIVIAFLLGLALNVFSQSDSVAFVHGPWLSEKVDGLVMRRCQFKDKRLFASNQQILVWELAPTADFTLRLAYYQFGTLAMEHDSVFILKTDTVPRWEEGLPYPNLMTARPLLLFDGEAVPLREDLGFVSNRHNRTAVGVRADGTVLLVVVDGRAPEAAGMSLQELQQVMRWLGCHTALNLDGGGSATFYADWGGNHGVLNCPSDNGRFDHEGERPVSNAVLVVKKSR